jgi:hypothetical protein
LPDRRPADSGRGHVVDLPGERVATPAERQRWRGLAIVINQVGDLAFLFEFFVCVRAREEEAGTRWIG